jgi:ABC-2 type transport system ATP-binding protein
VHEPALLFLDEPTAGVDVELRKDLWRTVSELRDRGTTIILTTHYIEEAEKLADRVGFFHRGRLRMVRERDALMAEHATMVVRIRIDGRVEDLPEALRARVTCEGEATIVARLDRAADAAALVADLCQHVVVHDLSMQRTSLEDIFVDVMRRADQESDA